MAARNSVHRRYLIPENMADGSKFMGFRIRNLVEAAIMGGTVAILSYGMLPISEFSMKFSITVILTAPFLCFGAVGFNGYPVSYFLKVVYMWFKNRGIILYDSSIRLLETSLLDNQMKQFDLRDKLFDLYHTVVQSSRSKTANQVLIEGVNFKFAKDKEEMAVAASRLVDKDELAVEEIGEEVDIILPGPEASVAPVKASGVDSDGLLVADEDSIEEEFLFALPPENEAEEAGETPTEESAHVQEDSTSQNDKPGDHDAETEGEEAAPEPEQEPSEVTPQSMPPKAGKKKKKGKNKKKGGSGNGKK